MHVVAKLKPGLKSHAVVLKAASMDVQRVLRIFGCRPPIKRNYVCMACLSEVFSPTLSLAPTMSHLSKLLF